MPNSVISVPSQPNRKLYNGGLEWQNDYGNLPDLYQTFYRNYDAALGRFVSIDPKAENSHSLNPYHYAVNNPLMFNDLLGDDVAGMDAYHYWYYAYRALMYSSDGGTANSRGDVSFFKNQKDAFGFGWGAKDALIDYAKSTSGSLKGLAGYAKVVKGVAFAGNVLSAGVVVTKVLVNKQIMPSDILEGVAAGASFIPGFGWAIGGGYFLGYIITKSITGESIGQHLNDYMEINQLCHGDNYK